MQNLTSAGARLQFIRKEILKLPPRVLQVKYGLSPYQVYSWEQGRLKIKESVLEQYKELFNAEGVLVSHEWILHGTGSPPTKVAPINVILSMYSPENTEFVSERIPEDALIQKELQPFLDYREHAICVEVESNAMSPFYFAGDYVCGEFVFSVSAISKLVGYDCIIQLENEVILIRRINNANTDGTFNLCCHLPLPGIADPAIFNIRIKAAARIILHRVKTPS